MTRMRMTVGLPISLHRIFEGSLGYCGGESKGRVGGVCGRRVGKGVGLWRLGMKLTVSTDGHGYEEPKTFADFVKPEYRWS